MPSALLPGSLPLSLLADPISVGTQVKDITVRLQTLDGTWETVGVDRMRGIVPEISELASDEWGPSTASFSLKRDPGVTWPDLGAWTPIEISVAGQPRWDGRIKETPLADGDSPVVHVQCIGWRQHLDDDAYDRMLVHTKLADYKDTRSLAVAHLASHPAGATVVSGQGAIMLSIPNGMYLPTGARVGVTLDLGPYSTAKRIVMTYEIPQTSVVEFFARGADTGHSGAATFDDAFTLASLVATTAATSAGTFTTPRRFIHLFLYYSGAATTPAVDISIRIKEIKLFADTAYESGNVSILKAPTIVRDALDRGTILLSSDRSGIDPTGAATFAYEEFTPQGQRTPREIIDAANAAMGWRTKIAVGRRPIFEPKPDAPAVEIGAWPGSSSPTAATAATGSTTA